MAKRTVLVTGATGFLGGAVTRTLVKRGWNVLATGRRPMQSDGISYHACDLARDPSTISHLTQGCHAVLHCAALSSPWGRCQEFEQANIVATRNIIQASERNKVQRIVYISSPSVLFEFKDRFLLNECEPFRAPPAAHYIATKRRAETLVMQSGLPVITLRPKALFGPGDTNLLPRVMRVAKRGFFPLFGTKEPLLDLTRIEDAVDAVVLALEAPDALNGRVYHITSGDPQPRALVLSTMIRACGLNVKFRHLPTAPLLAVASLLEMVSRALTGSSWEPPLTRYSVGVLAYSQTLDITAARQQLNYSPTTQVLEALKATGAAWLKSTPRGQA